MAVKDSEKTGFFHNVPICSNFNQFIIATPANVKVMSFLEFLKTIENHYL